MRPEGSDHEEPTRRRHLDLRPQTLGSVLGQSNKTAQKASRTASSCFEKNRWSTVRESSKRLQRSGCLLPPVEKSYGGLGGRTLIPGLEEVAGEPPVAGQRCL